MQIPVYMFRSLCIGILLYFIGCLTNNNNNNLFVSIQRVYSIYSCYYEECSCFTHFFYTFDVSVCILIDTTLTAGTFVFLSLHLINLRISSFFTAITMGMRKNVR